MNRLRDTFRGLPVSFHRARGHYNVDWENLYPAGEVQDLDAEALQAYLAEQTCCTTDKTAEGDGDPVNLVVMEIR